MSYKVSGLWTNQRSWGRNGGGNSDRSNSTRARRRSLRRRPDQLRRRRRRRHQTAGQGARQRSVLRLERPLFRWPCRIQPGQRTSRSRRARPDQLSQVVRQPQRRHPGWLQPRAAFAPASGRRGRPVRLECSVGGRACVVSHHGRHRPRREDRVDGNAARPRRLRVRPLDGLRHRRVRLVVGTLSFKLPASSTRPTGSFISTPAGRPVPERKSRSRRAGRSGWNISI